MGSANLIGQYHLEERILTLSLNGRTQTQISEEVSAELPDDVTVSQSTISRYLKTVKEQRAAQTDAVIGEYVDRELPGDLKILGDIKKQYLEFQAKILAVAQGAVKDISKDPFLTYDLRTLFAVNDRLRELVKDTLKILGVDADGDGESRFDPVDLSKYEKDLDKLKEGTHAG